MQKSPSQGLAGLYAATILVSAFLLFQVQPVISKMILPWFGGTPAVWTTCMLFFQTVLLAGYGYAHLLIRFGSPSWQSPIHLALLVGATLVLPITPAEAWQPTGDEQPTLRILAVLLASVGLPYFMLASTGPLLQAWYGSMFEGRSPYRLYALSNVGSLAALLSYPFVFEPRFSTGKQGALWSIAFGAFVLLCGGIAICVWYRRATTSSGPAVAEKPPPKPEWYRYVIWIALPALGSVMLLAVTNYICQDVAVVPFMWVMPLSIYLLTFIICFDREIWYRRIPMAVAVLALVMTLAVFTLNAEVNKWLENEWLQKTGVSFIVGDLEDNIIYEALLFLLLLFTVCMLCHGELVRSKPHRKHLTAFYLCVSAGGALGGFLVAVVCPLVFNGYWELNLSICAGFSLGLLVLINEARRSWIGRQPMLQMAGVFLASGGLLFVTMAQLEDVDTSALVTARSFYGVLSIYESYDEDDWDHNRELYHGRILHGMQFLREGRRLTPTLYYDEASGIGLALRYFPNKDGMRVGAVGLGAGTLAAYGQPGDVYRFYEINQQVIDLNKEHFSFLKETDADVEIELGDARLSLHNEERQQFDVLALDAFSGDAIPPHLLTKEAFEIYLRHMSPDGIIAVHISNRYLDLKPVVAAASHHFDIRVAMVDTAESDLVGEAGSTWLLMTNNKEFLEDPFVSLFVVELNLDEEPMTLWTDQYSNLLDVFDQ